MIIKKYVGKTESEATEEARKELGPNIVVMTVKPLKKTGFFAFFKPQKIEVTVGLEEEEEKAEETADAPAAKKPATPKKPVAPKQATPKATTQAKAAPKRTTTAKKAI